MAARNKQERQPQGGERSRQRGRQVAVLAWLVVALAAAQWGPLAEESWKGPGSQVHPQLSTVRCCQERRATHRGDCYGQGPGGRWLCNCFATCNQPSAQGRSQDTQGACRQEDQNGAVEQLGCGVAAHLCQRERPPSYCHLTFGERDGRGRLGARGCQGSSQKSCGQHGGGLTWWLDRACRPRGRVRRRHAGWARFGGVTRVQRRHSQKNFDAWRCEKGYVGLKAREFPCGRHASPEETSCLQPGYQYAFTCAASSAAKRSQAAWCRRCFSLTSIGASRRRSVHGLALDHSTTLQPCSRWTQEKGWCQGSGETCGAQACGQCTLAAGNMEQQATDQDRSRAMLQLPDCHSIQFQAKRKLRGSPNTTSCTTTRTTKIFRGRRIWRPGTTTNLAQDLQTLE